jgi:hypothetical protein
MDECLRTREHELREEHDAKIKAQKLKFTGELARSHDMLRGREQEID